MRGLRQAGVLLLAVVVGGLAAILTIYILIMQSMPSLERWHEGLEGADFREENAGEDFAGYLEREARLFAELDDLTERGARGGQLDRFAPGSLSDPERWDPNWNRSFVLEPEEIRGGALLLHGLSDSPYMMRAVGRILEEQGFYVVGLRVPGHGTVPGDLRRVSWRDWREALRVAARHIEERVGELPFWVAGYSSGGALAVDYALTSLELREQRPPDQLLLFAPAISVSPVAALAKLQRWIAEIPGLEKLAWTEILPEYDPFKYNSFPVAAGEQIHGLTSQLAERLVHAQEQGALSDFPPTLVFSSVVDATIPASAVTSLLLERLPANDSELVLFDVNRIAEAEDLLTTGHEAYLNHLRQDGPFRYSVTIVTNLSPQSDAVVARTLDPGMEPEAWKTVPLGLEWPRGVYSLAHTSLTLPASDSLYGSHRTPENDLHLGSVEVRGERGVFGVPMDLLMRLRYNPFFPYTESRIVEAVARSRKR